MAKAVISNRIFLDVTDALKKELYTKLTYKIPPKYPGAIPTVVRTMGLVNKTTASLPSGRLDLIPEDYEVIDRRVQIPVVWPEPKYDLRDSQKVVFDAVNDGAIINAPVSWGKCLALYLSN